VAPTIVTKTCLCQNPLSSSVPWVRFAEIAQMYKLDAHRGTRQHVRNPVAFTPPRTYQVRDWSPFWHTLQLAVQLRGVWLATKNVIPSPHDDLSMVKTVWLVIM